jgi:hypothetical protein
MHSIQVTEALIFGKVKDLRTCSCDIELEFPTSLLKLWPFYVGMGWLDLA